MSEDASGSIDGEAPVDEGTAVELEVTDVLDLHSFPPGEIGALVRDYLDLACERGFAQVRIVHGRGVGVQRERVRKILERDARVEAFGDAPAEAGGWGATWARLRAVPPLAGDPTP
ncbi:MAG TPA: Smr/MutS family protein [Thermoanaerobaculia bacterium]|nr:Smr/MutS family protein [Thermoanaerobaculia bacterium]